VYLLLRFIPFFRKPFFRRLFFWAPLLLPFVAIGLLFASMAGIVPVRTSHAFSKVYDTDPPPGVELGRAKAAAGTDFYEIYLSYRTDKSNLDGLNLVSRGPGDEGILVGGNDAPKWWRGDSCEVEMIFEPRNPRFWDENTTVLCKDGWFFAYALTID